MRYVKVNKRKNNSFTSILMSVSRHSREEFINRICVTDFLSVKMHGRRDINEVQAAANLNFPSLFLNSLNHFQSCPV